MLGDPALLPFILLLYQNTFTVEAECDASMILLIFTESWLSLFSLVYFTYHKFICCCNAGLERPEGNLCPCTTVRNSI